MGQVVMATFEDGLFKPDDPVDLKPHARVKLIIEDAVPGGEQGTDDSGGDPVWEDFERALDEIELNSGEPRPRREELYGRP